MEDEGYPSPEAFAVGDIPNRYAKVLAVSVSPDGAHAVTLVATNEEPWIDLNIDTCVREGELWYPGPQSWGAGPGGGSGSGRAAISFESKPPVTALILDGPAPPDATQGVFEFEGTEHRLPVSGGRYLFVGWDPDNLDSKLVLKHFE